MASITPLLSHYKGKDGKQQIVIRVEHERRHRLMPVGYKVPSSAWTTNQVSSKYPDAAIINSAIASKLHDIRRYFADCQMKGLTVRLELVGTGRTTHSFTEYLDHRAQQYKTKGKITMYRKVERLAKELRESFGRGQVLFDEITGDSLRDLENWQINRGNVNNTRHKKFKFLGEFFTHAIDEGKAAGPNPIKKYKIERKPVKKEKLSLAEITALEELILKPGPLADARNLFLFSYYSKGARFETCIMLTPDQVRNGRIYFRTNKGNDYISVKIHARLQGILDLYSGEPFVFPYAKAVPANPEAYLKVVDSRNVVVNRNLKAVALLAGIIKPLKFHIARHSFADHFNRLTDNIKVVQEALGHSDERITRMYINALGDEILDPEMDKLYGK